MQEMSFSNVLAAAFTLVAMQYQDRAANIVKTKTVLI